MTNLEAPLCTQTDPDLWFPKQPNANRNHSVQLAKALCRSCVAYDDCLDMFTPDSHTIQAALTPKEQVIYATARDLVE